MSVVAATETNGNDKKPGMDAGLKFVLWIIGIPVVCGVLLIALLIGGSIWAAVAGPSDEYKAEQFGTACYNEAKAQFKNPESAQLTDNGVTVVGETEDSTSYELFGTGSGMNGFGGYSTVTWECSGDYNNVTEQTYVNATVTNN